MDTLKTNENIEMSPHLSMKRTKGDLRALRTEHGANSPIGHACSNIDEMLENFAKSTDPDQKARLAANIQKENARLAQLLAAARQ